MRIAPLRFASATPLLAALTLLVATGCDRKIEPFDPEEEPREPDLSKIFPEGAEQAQAIQPGLPPAPGGGRGATPLPEEMAQAQAEARGAPAAAASASGEAIVGRVEVAPELADRTGGGVLFIIGRRGGGGPPLAVKRVVSPSFPLDFTLGPEDRMIQQMPFTGPITLSARLDGDGNASSSEPGDLMGAAVGGPVDPGAEGVVIRLDTAL